MKNFFSYDNPVMRFITKFGQLWYLNMLFLITSLPIFTIGASITALNYSVRKLRLDEGTTTSNYFNSWKSNFKQATTIWLIDFVLIVLLALAIFFYWQMDYKVLLGISIGLAIILFFSLIWVFAIQSQFVNRWQDTMKFSFIFPFRNLPETFLITIAIVAVVYFNVTTIVLVNVITINFGIGWLFLMFSFFYEQAFDPYIQEQKRKDKKRKNG